MSIANERVQQSEPRGGGASTRKLVSYVFPIYNEEGNIPLLHSTMSEVLGARKDLDFEFIFVNDGSRDSSIERLMSIAASDARVKVIDLSRNFGHQIAVTAGIEHALGDAVVVMDSDLQDPPEVSLQLVEKWEEGWDVVYAQRRSRQDTAFKKLTAHVFYRMLNRLAEVEIPKDTGDFRLMSRRVVDALRAMPEHNRFIRGMVSFIGFRQIAVPFDRHERHAGVTGYPLKKMIKFAADGMLSFSTTPLKMISSLGYAISALSAVGILYAVAMRLFVPQVTVSGWTFMAISILLIGGMQMVMLGVLGSYIGRIYTESQGRPLYLARELTAERELAGGRLLTTAAVRVVA